MNLSPTIGKALVGRGLFIDYHGPVYDGRRIAEGAELAGSRSPGLCAGPAAGPGPGNDPS
jgi:hypothetical protein